MRRLVSLLIVLLCLVFSCNFAGCSTDDKIAIIYLKSGHIIYPIDVYKVTGGQMW